MYTTHIHDRQHEQGCFKITKEPSKLTFGPDTEYEHKSLLNKNQPQINKIAVHQYVSKQFGAFSKHVCIIVIMFKQYKNKTDDV